MDTEPHFHASNRVTERQKLNQIVISKYEKIWAHHNMDSIIATYSRITSLTIALDEKGIKYGKDLKKALEYFPLENAALRMVPDIFREMIEKSNVQSVRHINEDFDIILMRMDENLCLRNLRVFIVDYSYKLTNFGKKKSPFGFDPNYSMSSATRHQRSHSHVNDE